MFKALVSVLLLAVGLTILVILSGYLKYRNDMNTCLEAGGIVIQTGHGLKCVRKSEVNLI